MKELTSFVVRGRRGMTSFGLLGWLAILLSVWSMTATAAGGVSTLCPTQFMTVANGGSVTSMDLANCDGLDNIGMAPAIYPAHGSILVSPQSGPGNQTVTYTHNGDTATSDTFGLEDDIGDILTFNVTITPSASAIVVSPVTLPSMVAGTPFAQTLTSSGGLAPYTYSLSTGTLPAGISLSPAGILSGTPTQRGGYNFSVRSQDSISAFVIKGYSGTVLNPTLSISPSSATAIQGIAFSQALTALGGIAPYSYALETGAFPAGISISSSGVISGTTSAAPASYPVTVRVTDASTGPGSYFEVESFTLMVSATPVVSVSVAVAPSSVYEDGSANLVYTFTRSQNLSSATVVNITTGGTATSGTDYTGGVATVTIPAGATTAAVTINPTADSIVEPDETVILTVAAGTGYTVDAPSSATGTILNDDVPSASITVAPAAVAEDGAANLVYTVTLDQPAFTPTSVDFSVAGTATSGTDYVAVSSPLIVSTGSTTGTITISPIADSTVEADETVIITLNAGSGYSVGTPASATGTILNDDVLITIYPSALSPGMVGTVYSQIFGASGGAAPYTFALTTGALPAGLVLSSWGEVSGTPTAGGTFNFTITATDSSATPGPHTGSQPYTFVIGPPTVILPATSLADGTLGTAYSGSLNSASGGTAPYAYALTVGALPGGLSLSSSGQISGTPSALGTFNFSVTATDSSTGTGPYTATQAYSITVDDQAPVANAVLVTVDYNSSANPVTLNITGGTPDSVAVAVQATHGNAVASGTTINYQPTSGYAGSDSFTYTATNTAGTSTAATVTVTVSDPVIMVTASGGFAATVGVAYTQTFTWSGGAAPYTGYQVTGLPAGLSITASDTTSATVSGTPTETGSFSLNASATDSSTGSGPFTQGQAFTLTVAAPTLTLTPATTTFNANYAAPFSQVFAASGGVGPYSYALTGTNAPGVSLVGDTLSGSPTAPGSYNFTITATDDGSSGTASPFTVAVAYTLDVSASSIVVDPPSLPDATTSIAYSATFSATGAVAPYTFAISGGSLPGGLTLASDGTLSGLPSGPGSFSFDVEATDSNSQSGIRSYVLVVHVPSLSFVSTPLPQGQVAIAYAHSLTATAGLPPYQFAVTAGALPPGLGLDSSGLLSGVPTQPGVYAFTVSVNDGDTPVATVSADFSVRIAAVAVAVAVPSLNGAGLLLLLSLIGLIGIGRLRHQLRGRCP